MFDVSFGEMLVIAVVALVVIGPEKLPKVARTLGLLAGRMQRYVGNIKADIDREMRMQDLANMQQEIHSSMASVQTAVVDHVREIEAPIAEMGRELNASSASPETMAGAAAVEPVKSQDPA